MSLIQADTEKCIGCGACANVCPRGIIRMDKKLPMITEPKACIICGHCVAVCPTAALDHSRALLSGQIPITKAATFDAQTAYQFLRSRRSVRNYKNKPIPKNELIRLMDIARFAPTAGNSQGLSYIVIQDAEILQKITALTVDWMEEILSQGAAWAKAYAGTVSAYRDYHVDVILRDAPCLVLAMAPRNFVRGRENSRYSLAYAELYAPTLGLGTCWAGFFEGCAFAEYQPLIDLLKLPDNNVVTGAIMVGYPVYQYSRLVDRNPLPITFGLPGRPE